MDAVLRQAAAAAGNQIELFVDGVPLVPTARQARVSLLSDRSFQSYDRALAHLQEPPLPADTDLFWNQGFFDLRFEYSPQTPRSGISIRVKVGPEVAQRIKLRLDYLPPGEPARSYEIPGDFGWAPLDPSWYEAAWLSVKGGFVAAFAVDRLLFLLCLVAPFRGFRGLLSVDAVFTGLQALTMTAGAQGALAEVDTGWLPALSATVLGASLVLLAIGNLAAPNLRRRWFIAAAVGAIGGFGVSRLLADVSQFAGAHALVATISFNVGVALGEVASLVVAYFALRVLFASVLGPLLGAIIVSVLLGHAGWHWMIDGGRELARQAVNTPPAGLWATLVAVVPWLMPTLVAGAIACFLPRRFDGVPGPTLLRALHARDFGDARARL
jgi:hypothetical protein